jgi:4'-phosphopantetheinyl transferase EntD
MIELILPAAAASAEAFDDSLDTEIFPQEQALMAGAVPRRRREFTTARACAHQALARLGVPAQPILRGERNVPLWPAGVIGSITHCNGYRAATVARATDLLGIGIDAEPNLPLPGGVLGAVALPVEHEQLASFGGAGLCWDRLLFCAKEAIFKVWFPLTGRHLDFEAATVDLHPNGTFEATILRPDPRVPARLPGRYLSTPRHLITAIAIGAARSG